MNQDTVHRMMREYDEWHEGLIKHGDAFPATETSWRAMRQKIINHLIRTPAPGYNMNKHAVEAIVRLRAMFRESRAVGLELDIIDRALKGPEPAGEPDFQEQSRRASATPTEHIVECICDHGFGMNLSCPIHSPDLATRKQEL